MLILSLFAIGEVACSLYRHVFTKETMLANPEDFCVAVPLYFGKNRDFASDEGHRIGTYFVSIQDEKDKQAVLNEAEGFNVVIRKAVGHIEDAQYSLQAAAEMCRRENRRLMFIYEMDVSFVRWKNSTSPPAKNISEQILLTLSDIVNEHESPFWILGSFYMGPMKIADPFHLNGNAIYDITNQCFWIALKYLTTQSSGGHGYDVAFSKMLGVLPPACRKTYESTPRICNYWRGVHTPDRRCWFVHN